MGNNSDSGAGTGGTSDNDPVWSLKDDIELDQDNPNIARAVPEARAQATTDETAGVTRVEGTFPHIIEGSDSERTGTSWGLPAVENAPTVETPQGRIAEGEGDDGTARPTRNVGERTQRDSLSDVGSWSTIDPDKQDSAGSPTGNA
jgi:hypothetical protein